MQLRKWTAVVPGLCLSLLLLGTLLAQQLPPASSPKPAAGSEKAAPAEKKLGSASSTGSSSDSGTSQGSATVGPPPEAAKSSAMPAADAGKQGSIRVTVNEVIVPVTVTDEKGRFVSDLDKKDFQVFEENRPQAIRYFTRERSQPVVIGFLLDLSTASRVHWKNYQDASIELVQNLLTGDPKYSGY